MPDPIIVLAVLCLIGSAFGFGFIVGEKHERARVRAELIRLVRLRKEGLLP